MPVSVICSSSRRRSQFTRLYFVPYGVPHHACNENLASKFIFKSGQPQTPSHLARGCEFRFRQGAVPKIPIRIFRDDPGVAEPEGDLFTAVCSILLRSMIGNGRIAADIPGQRCTRRGIVARGNRSDHAIAVFSPGVARIFGDAADSLQQRRLVILKGAERRGFLRLYSGEVSYQGIERGSMRLFFRAEPLRLVPSGAVRQIRRQERLQIRCQINVLVCNFQFAPDVFTVTADRCRRDSPQLGNFLGPQSIPDHVADVDFRRRQGAIVIQDAVRKGGGDLFDSGPQDVQVFLLVFRQPRGQGVDNRYDDLLDTQMKIFINALFFVLHSVQ